MTRPGYTLGIIVEGPGPRPYNYDNLGCYAIKRSWDTFIWKNLWLSPLGDSVPPEMSG